MSAEIGTEAAPFPEKEYMNGIFIAVYSISQLFPVIPHWPPCLYSPCGHHIVCDGHRRVSKFPPAGGGGGGTGGRGRGGGGKEGGK
jgi:hypothetical protein